MKALLTMLASCFALAALLIPGNAVSQECAGGLCGTPNQSGGGCGCGCGCSILVAMTDRGDTYQFADDFDGDGIEDQYDNCPFATNYAPAGYGYYDPGYYTYRPRYYTSPPGGVLYGRPFYGRGYRY